MLVLRPAGVIPIDRLTDVRAPIEVIARRIPRRVLEAAYGHQLPRPGSGDDANRYCSCALLGGCMPRRSWLLATSCWGHPAVLFW